MKSMKKILSLVIALAMVLSIAPLAMAAGDDGMGGVEQVLLNETFEGVSGVEFPYTLPATSSGAFNWKRNTNTTTGQEYIFENDGTNTYMSFYNPNSTSHNREASRALNSAVPSGSVVSIKLKFKYDSGVKAFHGFDILGHTFQFRTQVQGFYADGGQYWTPTYTAIYPNVWNDIEILLFPATGTENAKFQYYLGGTFITQGNYSSDLDYTKKAVVLRQSTGNAPTMGNLKIYYDDIIVTAFDNKRVCEIAADKISLPSSATGNIALPTSGFGGATISWSSDNTSLISNSGVVTRPENGDIQPVTLTATVTYGGTSVSFPYTVNVLPESVYFYEDFEGASVGKLAGYNSWTEFENTSYAHAFTGQVIQETTSNKAGMIWREANPTGSGNAGPAQYTVSRAFDNAIEGGIASVKMNVYFEDYVWMNTRVSDGTNSVTLQFKTNNSVIYYSGANIVNVQMLPDVWHNIEYRIDLPQKTFEIIFDGRSLYTIENITLTGVSSITFEENRTGLGNSTSTNEKFYFDNIVAQLIDVPYAYSVVDFAFKGADGAASLYPESDGSVSGVTIKKHKSAENAVLVAAVYDGGKLTKASAPINVTGALINAETTYPVSLPIASAATQIRVFALDKGTLVPLALDKTYEKRSPITVFIAGDSISENVSGSQSSKVVNGETIVYDREGWGMRIGEQFNSGAISVSNHAVGGRDTAEFISEGRLDSILAKGQRGDFVFVSFGHNDDGSNISISDYRANLASYSKAIKEKGMTPIFVTPVSRIATGADDSGNWTAYDDDLYTYAEAMVAEAAENGDVCLDLYTAFNDELDGLTYGEARAYYVPKNIDGTHLSPAGASLAASLIAELLGESASTLKDLLK